MNALVPLRVTLNQPPFAAASAVIGYPGVRHVLFVDDDQLTRRLYALLLARAGCSVDTADDGELGWDALRARQYDLLVTDHEMPRLTGLQLVERLRFAGFPLPVIITSGSPQLGNAEDYPWLSLTAILHKPFPAADLISATRRALSKAPDDGEVALPSLGPRRDTPMSSPFPRCPDAGPVPVAETA